MNKEERKKIYYDTEALYMDYYTDEIAYTLHNTRIYPELQNVEELLDASKPTCDKPVVKVTENSTIQAALNVL